MRRYALSFLVMFAVIVVVSACKKKLPPATSPQATIGAEAPPIGVQELNGKRATLKGVKGQPTILALWATWCQPCHEEMPALVSWWRAQEEVALIALAVESPGVPGEKVQEFIDGLSFEGTAWRTTPGEASPLGLRALPVVYLLDQQGVIRSVHEGFTNVDDLMAWLEGALDEL